MRTEVFQVQAHKFDEDGNLLPKHEREISFVKIGDVYGEVNNVETIWELTNHRCWMSDGVGEIIYDNCLYKPTKHDRGFSNDDIYFIFGGDWWVAKFIGWERFNTRLEAEQYLLSNSRMRE